MEVHPLDPFARSIALVRTALFEKVQRLDFNLSSMGCGVYHEGMFIRLFLLFTALLFMNGCSSRAAPASTAGREPLQGYVNVLCLQGCSQERGVPDTLFGCLYAARENRTGTLELPPGVYLGHVAEFIAGALEYYDIRDNFERYYGYRIVLRFREVRPDEPLSFDGLTRMAVGTAGDMAVSAAGGPMVSVSPVLFLFQLVQEENRIVSARKEAATRDLPPPSSSGFEVVVQKYRDTYMDIWYWLTGPPDSFADIEKGYVVEECYLEKPDTAEILRLASRPEP